MTSFSGKKIAERQCRVDRSWRNWSIESARGDTFSHETKSVQVTLLVEFQIFQTFDRETIEYLRFDLVRQRDHDLKTGDHTDHFFLFVIDSRIFSLHVCIVCWSAARLTDKNEGGLANQRDALIIDCGFLSPRTSTRH